MTEPTFTDQEKYVIEAMLDQYAQNYRSCPDCLYGVLPDDANTDDILASAISKLHALVG